MQIKTVTIDRDGQPVVINESDMQASDKLWGENPAPKKRAPAKKKAAK